MNTKSAIKNVADVPKKFNISGGTVTGRLTANGKISIPTSGSNFLSGKTITNASIAITTKQTEGSYHPILAVQTSSSHVVNVGGIKDEFGFYGYKANRTDNGTDWCFKFNSSNGEINSTSNITAPKFIGNLQGNANTATNLQSARTITIGKTGKSFNGSSNISWSTDEIGALDKFNDSTLASGKKILLGHISSWLTGDSGAGIVTLRAGGNLFIHGDADTSYAGEYVSIKAGNNDLKVISSGSGTANDKLTFNGNIVYHAGRKPTPAEIGAIPQSKITINQNAPSNPATGDLWISW